MKNNSVPRFIRTAGTVTLKVQQRRFGSSWLAVALASLVLAGCQGGAQTAPPPVPTAAAASPTGAAASPSPAPTPAPTEKPDPAAERLEAMTTGELIGQLLLVGIEGDAPSAEADALIRDLKVGGIILYKNNIGSPQNTVSLINSLKEANSGNPVPLFMSVDEEGGRVSRLPDAFGTIPSARDVGKTDDSGLALEMGGLLASRLAAAGFNMDFAPVLDVDSNPANPVIGPRSFGSDASTVSVMGAAVMNGLRQEGVIPVVKHFPGHGDTSVDSHLELPVVDKTADELAELELIPFKAAVSDQAEAVMVAHILLPEIDPDKPASLSPAVIDGMLREELGYDGVVITDDMTMGAIANHHKLGEAAVESVLAGSDIVLVAHGYDNARTVRAALEEAVDNGSLGEERLRQSVYRILALKTAYGLTDEAVPEPQTEKLAEAVKEWRDRLKEAAKDK